MARGARSKSDDAGAGRRKVREFDQTFEIKLSEGDRADEALIAVDLVREYDTLEMEIKEYTKPRRERMKKIRGLLSQHAANALTGKREDTVRVEEFYDLATDKIAAVRVDTGDTIKLRNPTKAEREDFIDFAPDEAH